jgi:hypothetical protein
MPQPAARSAYTSRSSSHAVRTRSPAACCTRPDASAGAGGLGSTSTAAVYGRITALPDELAACTWKPLQLRLNSCTPQHRPAACGQLRTCRSCAKEGSPEPPALMLPMILSHSLGIAHPVLAGSRLHTRGHHPWAERTHRRRAELQFEQCTDAEVTWHQVSTEGSLTRTLWYP